MNAAIYCRVSTEDQEREGSSLQSQRDYCLHKAHDLGYDVPEEYIFSEVFSGADTDRPKLIELRRLVKSHSVGSVVCYSTDRLARNSIHIDTGPRHWHWCISIAGFVYNTRRASQTKTKLNLGIRSGEEWQINTVQESFLYIKTF